MPVTDSSVNTLEFAGFNPIDEEDELEDGELEEDVIDVDELALDELEVDELEEPDKVVEELVLVDEDEEVVECVLKTTAPTAAITTTITMTTAIAILLIAIFLDPKFIFKR